MFFPLFSSLKNTFVVYPIIRLNEVTVNYLEKCVDFIIMFRKSVSGLFKYVFIINWICIILLVALFKCSKYYLLKNTAFIPQDRKSYLHPFEIKTH